MNPTEYGPDFLAQHTGPIKSRMGMFVPGGKVTFRGRDLHTELNSMDWFELYLFSVTGRRFSENQRKLLQSIWTYTSYPDVRLWNNRVAALSANSRSTGNLGLAAALAVSEASIYGRGIDKRVITFLLRTQQALERGESLEDCIRHELKQHRSIAGYGRPLINGDERNPHILALAKSLQLDQGKYLQLAFKVEEALLNGRWRMKMNYGAVVAALAADIGLSGDEYYLFMFPTFLAGMLPCLQEASTRSVAVVYPSRCHDVVYQGIAWRDWQ